MPTTKTPLQLKRKAQQLLDDKRGEPLHGRTIYAVMQVVEQLRQLVPTRVFVTPHKQMIRVRVPLKSTPAPVHQED